MHGMNNVRDEKYLHSEFTALVPSSTTSYTFTSCHKFVYLKKFSNPIAKYCTWTPDGYQCIEQCF